jgi:hypothetical protein
MQHLYREIKDALHDQIKSFLEDREEDVDVHKVNGQNLAWFPAVTIEMDRRRKQKVGVGVRQLELDMIIWVYVKLLDYEDAESEALRVAEIVEAAIESDKTLSGTAHYLSVDDEMEFGVVESEGVFLQGAKIRLQVQKRIR